MIKAIIIGCMDYRFQHQISQLIKSNKMRSSKHRQNQIPITPNPPISRSQTLCSREKQNVDKMMCYCLLHGNNIL